jgi:hypothetical protein
MSLVFEFDVGAQLSEPIGEALRYVRVSPAFHNATTMPTKPHFLMIAYSKVRV